MITQIADKTKVPSNYQRLFDKANAILGGTESQPIVYDLDSYFMNLKNLINQDRSFLRMPLDEGFLEITDDTNGRRIIQIPSDMQKNGVGVQGDNHAEMLWFRMNRYYDHTDLYGLETPMKFVIQWQTKTGKGVSEAFLSADDRPFLDNDKIYFGWNLGDNITKDSGNIQFNVRIYQIATNNGNNELVFNLNTQPKVIKINDTINYSVENFDLTNNTVSFKDNDGSIESVYGQNTSVVNRVQNSIVYGGTSGGESASPEVQVFIPSLAGKTKVNDCYEFDLENGKLNLNTFAISEDGGYLYNSLLYSNASMVGGTQENGWNQTQKTLIKDLPENNFFNSIKLGPVDNIRFYTKDEAGVFILATDLPEEWTEEDKNIYYINYYGDFEATQPGYYHFHYINTLPNHSPKSINSDVIYIPFAEAPIVGTTFNSNVQHKTLDDEHKVELVADNAVVAKNKNALSYKWYKNDVLIENTNQKQYEVITTEEDDLSVLNDVYKVEYVSTRNSDSKISESTSSFRVTDKPHNFDFSAIEYSNKVVYDNNYPKLEVNFGDLLTEGKPEFVSDKITYQWKKVKITEDEANSGSNDFTNDIVIEDASGEIDFLQNYSIDKIEFQTTSIGTYYCEFINHIGDSESIVARTKVMKVTEPSI